MQRLTQFVSVAACIAVTAAIALPVAAQFSKPEDAVKYRQAAFTVLNNHMGRINTQLKSSTPNVCAEQARRANKRPARRKSKRRCREKSCAF